MNGGLIECFASVIAKGRKELPEKGGKIPPIGSTVRHDASRTVLLS